MDIEPSTPLVTVGHELATFLASCGILHKAWEEILGAYISYAQTFVLNEYEGVVYVTFPSLYIEDFVVRDSKYGECNIQNKNSVFSDCLKGNGDQPVLVHKGALNRFLHIFEASNFKALIENFANREGELAIVFVGHSIGGAVATLATLWFLEKRLTQISAFCITFGSPLVGDVRLGEVINREDWSGKFCHVVSKHDIVPRMLLAPFESITEPLRSILPHWGSIKGNASPVFSHPSIQHSCRSLLNNVMQYTSTIANDYTGESGLISPYRPFGTYMFCSTYGATCIEDPEAVLKMLHSTMKSTEENSFEEIASACISEHMGYGDLLAHITEYLFNRRKMAEHTPKHILNYQSIANPISDSFEMGLALQLEAMGVGVQNDQVLPALRKAAELKKKHDMNIEKLYDKLSKNQSTMAWLEWYNAVCKAQGSGCYDSFKQQSDKKDIKADLARGYLGRFWDEIINMEENNELPCNFRSQNKWINAGTAYRRLVEPLDIAEYYRTHKGNEYGSYLSQGVRPPHHIVLEKWMNEKEKTKTRSDRDKKPRRKFASLTQDPCFWARLEEASKALTNIQQLEQEKHEVMDIKLNEKLGEFENYVWNMIRDRSVCAEVFLQNSSFMIWWQQYSYLRSTQWKLSSSLFKFMECESWKSEA